MKKVDYKKVLIAFVGVIFMGVTLSILNIINYGMDSFTYMNVNIAGRLGLSLGNWQMILNILMLIPVIIWGRKQIGIGTLFNMVLIGYTVDFCMMIWDAVGLEEIFSNTVIRVVVMLPTVAIFIFSAATYMSVNLGTAPFDALPLMIWEKIGKVPFKVVRFFWDLTAVVIGFILSGKVGVVTILMVMFLGQAVEFVKKKFFTEK